MTTLRFRPIAAALLLCLVAPLSYGQYVWVDGKGVKQYSDIPPPADVPESRILKQPAKPSSNSSSPEDEKAAPTVAEKNAEFNKRRLEQEQKEKEQAEQAKYAAAKAKECERARSYRQTLESGIRVVTTDAKGERSFMTDEQRAREVKETQQILSECNQ